MNHSGALAYDSVNNIENSFIEIHNIAEKIPFNIIDEGEHFGVLTLKIAKTGITNKPLFILFTIDKTGSMNQSSGKKKYTKLDYVKQTFKNMINYLATLDVNVYIRVHSFNESVDVTVDTILVVPNALTELIQQIDKLTADGLTNIENALKMANLELDSYAHANPTHQFVHIFMTDGEATTGNDDVNYLYNCVNSTYNNIFMGYGLDHNANLLCKLSEHENAEYRFVDNMENTALIYGETIHRFLYPAITNVEIQMVYALIYDWKTDEWTDCIRESALVGEIEKYYQIKTKMPDEIEAHISGIVGNNNLLDSPALLDIVYALPDLVDDDGNIGLPTDLTKFIFRQRTQELLFDARASRANTDGEFDAFKQNLQDIFRRMRRYMRLNDMAEDGFMKMLCDDICITYKTFGKKHGQMYSAARANSQGRQQTYNTGAYIDSDDENDNSQCFDPSIQSPILQLKERPPFSLLNLGTSPQMSDPNTFLGEVLFNGRLREITDLLTDTITPQTLCDATDLEETIQSIVDRVDDEPDTASILRRNSRSFQIDTATLTDDTYLPIDELCNYVQTDTDTTCYSTPSVLRTMHNIAA